MRIPDYEQLATYANVTELRDVADAVKHAEGTAAERVRRTRPDLFELPILRGSSTGSRLTTSGRLLAASLINGGLWVTREDLAAYHAAVMAFWQELREAVG